MGRLVALVLVCGAPAAATSSARGGRQRTEAFEPPVEPVCPRPVEGPRSVMVPARLTRRAGRAIRRVRTVRATVAWPTGPNSPMVAVQRRRLWASTAHCSHALLALKLPEGACSMPAPSFRSRMASSTTACCRWKASRSTALPVRSVRKAK